MGTLEVLSLVARIVAALVSMVQKGVSPEVVEAQVASIERAAAQVDADVDTIMAGDPMGEVLIRPGETSDGTPLLPGVR